MNCIGFLCKLPLCTGVAFDSRIEYSIRSPTSMYINIRWYIIYKFPLCCSVYIREWNIWCVCIFGRAFLSLLYTVTPHNTLYSLYCTPKHKTLLHVLVFVCLREFSVMYILQIKIFIYSLNTNMLNSAGRCFHCKVLYFFATLFLLQEKHHRIWMYTASHLQGLFKRFFISNKIK